jgi:aspartate-semialdehyde dehydrogenase
MKIEVGILGATGMVGQHLVRLIENHPWFEVKWVAASERSSGKSYADATPWRMTSPLPATVRNLTVDDCRPANAPKLVFSALDAGPAREIEPAFAALGHIVVSNASAFRMTDDVPLLLPEINADHAQLAERQASRGWKGRIYTNGNCSAITLTLALAPIHRAFGLKSVLVTTMQAVSGAGYPGVPSYDILGNVIPYIKNEEEKLEEETQRILGKFDGTQVVPGAFGVSAQCNRVPVIDGHTQCVSVALNKAATLDQLKEAWTAFRGVPQERGLPSAPAQPIVVRDEIDRPQPRLDVERGGGMTVFVGRARKCPILDYKFVALGHNTVRGAAGAALLNAELVKSEGKL